MAVDNGSYNKGGLIAFIGSMAFSIIFILVISFIYPGVDLKEAREEAKQAEQALAQEGAQKPAFDAAKITEPWVSSEEMVAHGAEVFKANCAICHGDKGLGDGMAGKSLVPPPRNFVKGDWKQGGSSIDLLNTITNGINGTSMAAFGHIPLVDRWSLVHFIRSITGNKVQDDEAKLKQFGPTAK